MYRSERQATQRQNKTSIEEAYFQRPFDITNYNDSTMEYTYDIPQQFNVSFLNENQRNKRSKSLDFTKTIEEAPFILSNSVAFAIADAISQSRHDNHVSSVFSFTFPMTPSRFQQLCGIKL